MTKRQESFHGWLSSAWVAALAVAGCGSIGPTSTEQWSMRTQTIVQSRIDHAHETVDRESSPEETASLRESLLAEPISATRLVADTPDSRSAGQAEPAAESASPVGQAGPLPGFRETLERDLKEMPNVLWDDTKKVYGNPGNLIFLLGAGGASAALRPEVDDDVEDYYDRKHSMGEDWRDAFGAAGNPGVHFALAGVWYLTGQQMQHDKTYEVGKRMFSALIVTDVSVQLLKWAANTESPNGEELAWPSGHVASTMAMATVLNDAYGPLVGVPMFGLTGLVGLERLDSGEHHLSDLIFGAAMGWVVAETIMKERPPEILGGALVPYIDPAGGNAGIAWLKNIGPP